MKKRIVRLLLGSASLALAADVVLPPGGARVVVSAAPREMALRDLRFREAGLAAAAYFAKADEIRIFTSVEKTNESPAARIWINSAQTNRYWYHTGGTGSAEGHVIPAGAAVAVVLRASTNTVAWPDPLSAGSGASR